MSSIERPPQKSKLKRRQYAAVVMAARQLVRRVLSVLAFSVYSGRYEKVISSPRGYGDPGMHVFNSGRASMESCMDGERRSSRAMGRSTWSSGTPIVNDRGVDPASPSAQPKRWLRLPSFHYACMHTDSTKGHPSIRLRVDSSSLAEYMSAFGPRAAIPRVAPVPAWTRVQDNRSAASLREDPATNPLRVTR